MELQARPVLLLFDQFTYSLYLCKIQLYLEICHSIFFCFVVVVVVVVVVSPITLFEVPKTFFSIYFVLRLNFINMTNSKLLSDI